MFGISVQETQPGLFKNIMNNCTRLGVSHHKVRTALLASPTDRSSSSASTQYIKGYSLEYIARESVHEERGNLRLCEAK